MAGCYFEVLEMVEEPETIYEGKMGECIAVREMEKGKYIVVVYRGKEDGFVITTFLTRRRSLRGGERYGRGGGKKGIGSCA